MKSVVNVVLVASLFAVSSAANYPTCNSTVLSCIKDINGGSYPANLFSAIKVIWNNAYSIVWYSDYMAKRDNLTCLSTEFGLGGCVDSYWTDSCNLTKEVSFKTNFNPFSHVFSIKNYEDMNLNAYAIHAGKYCLGLYVCSEHGVKPPHITLYCPTKSLSRAAAEIEEAKAKFTSCNINDGVQLCSETC